LRFFGDYGVFLKIIFPDSACDWFGKDCVFSEKMIFYKMSRALFFEKFGGVFFLRFGSGHFLESYAVFLGTFCRFGLEAGVKTGVGCLGFYFEAHERVGGKQGRFLISIHYCSMHGGLVRFLADLS
jgi:hypothetical protein